MKLSITSNAVHSVRAEGKLQFLPHLGIGQCAQAGFDRMEYNFMAGPADAKPLAADDWQPGVALLRRTLEENRITVPYTHAHWYLISKMASAQEICRQDTMVRRSVEATHMLGSKLMVVHTQSLYQDGVYAPEKTREYNKAFLSEMGELAAPYGIRIAVENLFPIAGAIDFASYSEELAWLMEQMNDPMFGVCWDFGHANMAKLDHAQALETVVPWLRLIHVDDNSATADIHTIPGCGTVPWEQVMSKLKRIGYTGDLNLSVRTFTNTTLPDQRVKALKFLHEIGTDLIRMYEHTCV